MAHIERDDAVKRIKDGLFKLIGRRFNVHGSRGTAWGWIDIKAPKARAVGDWHRLSDEDRQALQSIWGNCHDLVSPESREWTVQRLEAILAGSEKPWCARRSGCRTEVEKPGQLCAECAEDARIDAMIEAQRIPVTSPTPIGAGGEIGPAPAVRDEAGQAAQEGGSALPPVAPPPAPASYRAGEFPKRCSCSSQFTAEGWAMLPLVGYQREDGRIAFEIRNCTCGSTLYVEMASPVDEAVASLNAHFGAAIIRHRGEVPFEDEPTREVRLLPRPIPETGETR
jgi:hypothetical protein